jgi:hypothetical protein
MIRRMRVLSFALALSLATASIARAEPTEEQKTLAESLFQDAKSLMKQGKYAEACPKLAESFRLDAAGGTMINWADCEAHLGHWATALTYYRKARTMAVQAKRNDRVQICDDQIPQLEKKVARVVVNVASPAKDTHVALDGVELGQPAWGTAMMIDPGAHAIDVTAPGKTPFHADVTIGDAPETKTVDVPALADAATGTTSSATIDAPSSTSSKRTVGWIVGGVGVVAVGVGTYFLIHGNSLKNEVNDDPHALDVHDKVSSQHTAITIAELGLGVGIAALGTAAWLIATSPNETPKPTTGVRIAPLLGANAGGVWIGGAW